MTYSLSADKALSRKRTWLISLLLLVAPCACRKEDPSQAQLARVERQQALPAPPRARLDSHKADEPLEQKTANGPKKTTCPVFLESKSTGSLGAQLGEVSGLVASEEYPGLLWAHNDSGDSATLYSISMAGKLERSFRLPRQAHDWEDIAILSRPDKRALIYIADTGDNWSRRTTGVVLHRFKEPHLPYASDAGGDRSAKISKVESMHLTYPDGAHDSEALLVDPWTAQVVLITKEKLGWPQIYSVEDFTAQATLHHEGAITAQSAGATLFLVTGADVSPDGHWIILRTYTGVYLFYRGAEQSLAEALKTRACLPSPPKELQGESIAFLRTPPDEPNIGRSLPPSFLTVSEGAGASILLSESKSGLP